MPPFRWPTPWHDIALATEVVGRRPNSSSEWENIGQLLSCLFSSDERKVEVSGRGCRERLDRLLSKYKEQDKKALKKSGTEEEYSELMQLLEDISTYKRDSEEQKEQEKAHKKQKEKENKRKAMEMREAALRGMSKKRRSGEKEVDETSSCSDLDDADEADGASADDADSTPKKKGAKQKARRRASKQSAIEMLADKNNKRAEFKEKELELRRMELEFQQRKYEAEAEERKAKFQLEVEERKAMLALLKEKL